MNLIKYTRPERIHVSNKTPDDRIVKLVIAIELEVKKEQFRLCFMSQNRIGVEYGGGLRGPGPPPRQKVGGAQPPPPGKTVPLIYSRALIIVPIVCACDIPHGIQ